jgi:hypothetical protein
MSIQTAASESISLLDYEKLASAASESPPLAVAEIGEKNVILKLFGRLRQVPNFLATSFSWWMRAKRKVYWL